MPHMISSDRAVIEWRNESTQKPPKAALYLHEAGAERILKSAYEQTATVWTGDFHNAKQVLSALKKRVRKPSGKKKTADVQDMQTAFHSHRIRQAQQSRVLNMLAVEIGAGFVLDMPRAPDVSAALADVYGEANHEPFLLPLNQLLGFIGAHEWHKKGIALPQLGGRIHVPFGVFSPIRGEYLDLLAAAPLPPSATGIEGTAFDIGTGSGVIAALLAKRGVPRIVATDTNPRAVAAARANFTRLGCADKVDLQTADLFPEGCADLIVCNPPWLPAKPTSDVETALYDPDSAMLRGFLNGVRSHLKPNGEAWLVISDLAEHLSLRESGFLARCLQTALLEVVDVLQTKPQHAKAFDGNDPLAFARSRETTFLYRLKAAD
ncbi:methyltransferase [Neisseria animalis]|uniref:Class I SAM-dependent methyltransferase n=1 Tax=Neisseria animalis TaxID=492 RepID=A0A5P3MT10_NEIAN|nr:class I SAM-dependent methyltransferase [Neisseria animalis]QEY24668.1 class I SAM-dependent methyltransferase [Neisseria animalis]ROW31466.1 class I SAM-dependent methyltransferase [Neisseria animalis]VEE07597.1 methyltransferase domain protein [Neisseria animalis]